MEYDDVMTITCDISTIIIHYLSQCNLIVISVSQCNLIVISVYILFMMVPSGSQTIRNGSLPREIREWEKDIHRSMELKENDGCSQWVIPSIRCF
jgi:hypothetical protein